MRVYEITGAMLGLIQKYNEAETDQQLLDLERALKDTEIAFNDKALAVGYHIRNVEADVAAIDNEIERLEKLKASAKKERDFFKEYLKRSMEQVNSGKIETSTMKISIVKNPPSVVILDENLVPEKYKRVKTIIDVDKNAILQAHKEGIGVDGTVVEQKRRLSLR